MGLAHGVASAGDAGAEGRGPEGGRPDARRVRVFISSPADVMPERAVVERAVARVADVWKSHVRLEAVRWERKHYDAARSFQEAIGEMAEFDIVLGILWKRIGSPLPPDLYRRPDGSAYESGTAFELESAIAGSEQQGRPSVYLFRKTAPITYTAEGVDEERRQYQALNGWWNRTFRDAEGHFRRGYQEFAGIEELEQSVEKLLETYLRERGLVPQGAAWDIDAMGSPYPGLVAYDRHHSGVFFGRSLAINAAMEELLAAAGRDTPVLFVVGPSGSGKSSLARAGLAPRIAGRAHSRIDFWRTLLIEPSEQPFEGLAQRLYDADCLPEIGAGPHATPQSFAGLAAQAPANAASAVQWALQRVGQRLAPEFGGRIAAGRLLVLVDQLETVLDSPHRAALGRFLHALVREECAWAVATLRSDRYAELQLDPEFFALRRRGAMFDLPPPGASEIAARITGPARAAELENAERDGESLAKVVNAAVRGGDALPLLQMTLKRLFDARVGRRLTFAAYEQMNGLEGAIAAHAESVFAGVSPAGQHALEPLLRDLVADIGEDGRLAINTPPRAALRSDPAMNELVEKFIEGRLLVDVDGSVRIAHEALLRHWQRALACPALDPEAIRLRRQIEPSFATWRRTGLDADLLQSGTTALAAAQALIGARPGVFPTEMEDFVRRSADAADARARAERTRAEAEARRRRRTAYAAFVALLVIGALSIGAFVVYGQAQRDLSLRLLTKAEQFLEQEKPTRTLVTASAASGANVLPEFVLQIGALPEDAGHAVRARSLARIAAPAGNVPLRTLKLPSPPRSAALSGDGSWLALGDAQGRILLEPADGAGQPMRLAGHKDAVRSIAFAASSRMIATAGDDRTVRLWDLEARTSRSLCGHRGRVVDLALDPSGRYLASASYDGDVLLWDTAAAALARRFPGTDDHWALAVAFSPDGGTLASSDADGNLFLRRLADGTTRRIKTGRKDLVSIAFHRDGRLLATASIHGALDVWDTESGDARPRHRLQDDRRKLWKVRFSPDGKWLAASSWEGTVRLWDARSFQYAGSVDAHDHWVNDIAFARDASRLLTASESGLVRLWRTADIRPMFMSVRDDDRETLTGAYSRDGTLFVSGGRDGLARLYTVDADGAFRQRCEVRHRDWVISAVFAPDGRSAISAGTKDGKTDNALLIWDTEDCRTRRSIDVGDQFVTRTLFRPDGRQVAWGTRKGEVWLMDLDGQERPMKLPDRHGPEIASLDYAPDSTRLATAGTDKDKSQGNVVLWDVARRSVQRELAADRQRATAVRFSPDGRTLATAGYDASVKLWDAAQGDAPLARLAMRTAPSGALHFSPDGAVLASGSDGRTIDMWSAKSRALEFQLTVLVGVRGVFGFHPRRGDLAFDGERGVIKVLPGALGGAPANGVMAHRINGTEVLFDRLAGNTDLPRAASIDASAAACPAP